MGFFNRKKKAEKDKHIKQEVSEETSQKQSEADIDTTQEELDKLVEVIEKDILTRTR